MTLKIWNRLLFQIGLVHALIVYRTMTAVLSLSFVEPNKPDRPKDQVDQLLTTCWEWLPKRFTFYDVPFPVVSCSAEPRSKWHRLCLRLSENFGMPPIDTICEEE